MQQTPKNALGKSDKKKLKNGKGNRIIQVIMTRPHHRFSNNQQMHSG